MNLELYPFVLLIPSYSTFYSLLKFPLRVIIEITLGRLYVALPIALAQDVEFIIVQGIHLTCDMTYAGADLADNPQQP